MPDEMSQLLRRLDATERNQSDFARQHTELVEGQRGFGGRLFDLEKENAVRLALDKALHDRLERIEARIDEIRGLGKWLLAAVGSVLIAAIIGFIIQGGLSVGH